MAGLTKQHFIEIARILNEAEKSLKQNNCTLTYYIDEFAKYFKTQNPLFNENQFKKACLK